jgi:TPR repeat protein
MGWPSYRRLFSRSKDPTLEAAGATAEGGDAEGQFRLGLTLAHEGAAQDYLQAAHWYQKAANQNHAGAQFNLGVMFATGQGVLRDDALSLVWIRKAAYLGDPGAQNALGMRQWRISLDEKPENARESRIEANKWLRLAAAQGYPNSEVNRDSLTLRMTREDVVEGGRRAAAFVPN